MSFLIPIGTALGVGGGGTAAAVAGGAALAATGAGIASAAGAFRGGQQVGQGMVMPEPVKDVEKIKEDEKNKIRSGYIRKNLLTGPKGLTEPASVKRKVLLGE